MGTKWKTIDGKRVWVQEEGDPVLPNTPPFAEEEARLSAEVGTVEGYSREKQNQLRRIMLANSHWQATQSPEVLISDAIGSAASESLVGTSIAIADSASLGTFSTYGKADLALSGQITATEAEELLWGDAKEKVIAVVIAVGASTALGEGPTGRGPLFESKAQSIFPEMAETEGRFSVRVLTREEAAALKPSLVGGTTSGVERNFVPGKVNFHEPPMNLSPQANKGFKQEGFTLNIGANKKWYSTSELDASFDAWNFGERNVSLRPPTGARAAGGTSDLLVNGRTFDVFTPITSNPNRVISAIAKKSDQAQGVFLDLRSTGGPIQPSALGNVMARLGNIGGGKIKAVVIKDAQGRLILLGEGW